MTQPLCLVARCQSCGKIGAASFIGPDKTYAKELGRIVQKVLKGYTVGFEREQISVSGCKCTEAQRYEAAKAKEPGT